MRSRAFLLVAAIWCVAPSVQTAAKWNRLESANFVFIGNVSESALQRTADELEHFRDVMMRELPKAAVASPVPTMVFVFDTDRSFTPYKPRFQGRPVAVGGYFVGGEDINYIAIGLDGGASALHATYHEYAHFLIGNTIGLMPVWANEGLAEVYATFQQNDGGKSVTLGMPNAQHLVLLRTSTPIPLTDLLAVDHTSRLYNEDNRRGLFYAESWALVHYLTYGNPARRQQLGVYLAKLALGTSPDLAFRDAFQIEPPVLEQELQSYVRKFAFPTVRVEMGDRASLTRGKPAEAIAEYDAAAYLSDLVARVGRDDEEARTRLRGILDAHGDSWRAALVLGRLELRAGHLNDALPLLERAVTLAPDDASVQAAWGKANFAQYHDGLGNDLPATLATARAALNKAIALAPNEAATIALLGDLELVAGTDLALATTLLERAVALAPAREWYRLDLAEAYSLQQNRARALSTLGQLVARGTTTEIREAARTALARVVARPDPSRPLANPVNGGAPATAAAAPSISALRADAPPPTPAADLARYRARAPAGAGRGDARTRSGDRHRMHSWHARVRGADAD